MCGIAGFSGRFQPDLADRMGEMLSHRGPDDAGSGVFACGDFRVGLAHRRLSIIDLSDAGHQPMSVSCERCESHDKNGRIWLVYNGELYNFRELRQELEDLGHTFLSASDSEVLLHLYAEYGPDMLSRLNGIFAFAIYDARRTGQKPGLRPHDLFLARDGFGVKPLYVADTEDGFLFASELKALTRYPDLDRRVDPHSLWYYLSYLWAPAPHTMMRGVSKLAPGSALIVRGGTIQREWCFYDLPYGRPLTSDTLELTDPARIAETLARKIETAVSRQMVSDVPVGAFLSGGLDSSAVVAFASGMTDRPMDCFTIDLQSNGRFDGFADDLPFARQVAKDLGVRLHTVKAGPDMVDRLEEMIFLLDEPQADPAPLNALLICELARKQGIKVLLSGAGGDDILSGYRRHAALAFERYWAWLPRVARKGIKHISGRLPENVPTGRRLSKAFASAHLDREDRLVRYFQWMNGRVLTEFFSDDIRQQLASDPPPDPLKQSLLRIPSETDALNRMLYLETKHFLADHNLNYTDRMGMAAGVEVRVPFLDPDLVAFAAKIPSRLKQRGRTGKYIFKKAMEPYLARSVIYRPKTGFGAPLRQWLHTDLKPVVAELLGDDKLKRYGLFDPPAVRRLIQHDRDGKVDAGYTIFSLMCIQWWMTLFSQTEINRP